MKKVLLTLSVLASAAMLRAQNPYPVLPVDSVQFVNDSKLPGNDNPDYINPTFKNPTYRDTVRFDGIVASNPRTYGLSSNRKAAYIQRKGGGPWSGVLVMCEPSGTGTTLPLLNAETKFYDNFVVGYPVRVTGVIRAFQGDNQINLIRDKPGWSNAIEQLSLTKDTLVHTLITVDSLMTGNPNTTWTQQKLRGEKWEGVLVEIRNVTVTNITRNGNTRWNWQVIDDNGNALEIRDMSAYFRNDDLEDTVPKVPNTFVPPIAGTRLSYIRGFITEYTVGSTPRYGIAPYAPNDLGPCNICPPSITNVKKDKNIILPTDSVTISARITGDTTITSAKLYYAVGDTTRTYTEVTMTGPDASSVWAGKIPNQVAGSVVKYWIRAIDARGIRIASPDTLATNSAYLVVGGNITSIRTLQYSASGSGATIFNNDSLANIDVRGIITGTNFNAGATRLLTLQDSVGPNSAIFIQRAATNDITEGWRVGDSVRITNATVRETFNITTLNNVIGEIISRNNPLPPFQMNLSIDSFALNRVGYSRPWEAVLLKWDSVMIHNPNPDAPSNFDEFAFAKDTANPRGLRVDDMSISLLNLNDDFVRGTSLAYIQGPMYFSFGNFKLMPRSLSDLGLCSKDTMKPVITLIGNAIDTIVLGATYTQAGANMLDGRDGTISNMVTVSGTVNTAVKGTYTLVYKGADYCGNMADSVVRTVVVKDSSTVGMMENQLDYAQIKLYPVPAKDQLTVSANFIKTVPVEMTIVDLLGKTHFTRTYTQKDFTEQVDISKLNSGIYFCVFKNNDGIRTIKFMVGNK